MRKNLLVVFTFLITFQLYAQWSKQYVVESTPAPNSYYQFIGGGKHLQQQYYISPINNGTPDIPWCILRLDSLFHIPWQKSIHPDDTDPTYAVSTFENWENGTYVNMSSSSGDHTIMKIDSGGAMMWSKKIIHGSGTSTNVYKMVTDGNDLYIFISSGGPGESFVIVNKLDANGNSLWQKKIYNPGKGFILKDAKVDENHHLHVYGIWPSDIMNIILDTNGNLLHTNSYSDNTPFSIHSFEKICAIGNGQCMFSARGVPISSLPYSYYGITDSTGLITHAWKFDEISTSFAIKNIVRHNNGEVSVAVQKIHLTDSVLTQLMIQTDTQGNIIRNNQAEDSMHINNVFDLENGLFQNMYIPETGKAYLYVSPVETNGCRNNLPVPAPVIPMDLSTFTITHPLLVLDTNIIFNTITSSLYDTTVFTITELCSTQLGIESNEVNIEVFPNPTTDFIQLNSGDDIVHYDLISQDGRNIRTQNGTGKSMMIPLQDLIPGLYILRVHTVYGKISHQKIMKVS